MLELQRRNRISLPGIVLLGTVLIVASIGWVDAQGKSHQLQEAWEILKEGFTPKTPPNSVSPYIMPWTLDDGTVMSINLPAFGDTGSV